MLRIKPPVPRLFPAGLHRLLRQQHLSVPRRRVHPVVRAQAPGRHFSSHPASLTSLIERIFDGLVMLLFVFIALPFAPSIPLIPAHRRRVDAAALCGHGRLHVDGGALPARVERFYAWFADRLLPARFRPKVDMLYMRFMDGIESLSSGCAVLMIFGTSVIIWLLETVKYWFVMHVPDFSVSFLVLMLMNGLVNPGHDAAVGPGYIGTFDMPGIETLAAFGVNRNIAASYTFTLHLALWLPVTLLSGYFFWRHQLHWDDFQRAQAAVAEAGRNRCN
ncbi:MAG: lysylphosphatidylglycerol synthase transmembrane domain-containing protein [Caldilineaceae bacterium]